MSDTKFTPGPWKAEPKNNITQSVVSSELSNDWGIVIWMPSPPFAMGATGAAICTANRSAEESAANASLIAAAPDLYVALEAILQHGGELEDEWIDKERYEQARAALAKARGKV